MPPVHRLDKKRERKGQVSGVLRSIARARTKSSSLWAGQLFDGAVGRETNGTQCTALAKVLHLLRRNSKAHPDVRIFSHFCPRLSPFAPKSSVSRTPSKGGAAPADTNCR